tara:strand:- start:270 stop:713 length:444 start_codon:yes stop_codon:yes gene_type:complete
MSTLGLLNMDKKTGINAGTVYGTVREVMIKLSKKNPKLKPWSARNVASDKKLRLKIIDDEGNQEGINCSSTLSKLLRSKEITLTQVLDFRVVEHTVGEGFANAGLVTPLIILPDAEDDTSVEGVDAKAKGDAYSAETTSLEDLLSYS